MKLLLCFLLAMVASGAALSATYVYTGPYYTTVIGNYTTSMRITGSFITANPLPPNLSNVEVGPYGQNLVTSWSVNNGVTTFTNYNSAPNSDVSIGFNGDFVVSTDGVGNITEFMVSLQNPPNASREVDVTKFHIGTSPVRYSTGNLPACPSDAVITICQGPNAGGLAGTSGSFTTVLAATVPTLTPGGVLLLVGLMAIAVGFGTRRKSN